MEISNDYDIRLIADIYLLTVISNDSSFEKSDMIKMINFIGMIHGLVLTDEIIHEISKTNEWKNMQFYIAENQTDKTSNYKISTSCGYDIRLITNFSNLTLMGIRKIIAMNVCQKICKIIESMHGLILTTNVIEIICNSDAFIDMNTYREANTQKLKEQFPIPQKNNNQSCYDNKLVEIIDLRQHINVTEENIEIIEFIDKI